MLAKGKLRRFRMLLLVSMDLRWLLMRECEG